MKKMSNFASILDFDCVALSVPNKYFTFLKIESLTAKANVSRIRSGSISMMDWSCGVIHLGIISTI